MIKGKHSAKFNNVLCNIYKNCRFMAYFFMNCEIEPTKKIPTMGVTSINNRVRLLYNEKFVEDLKETELSGILAHEFMHVVNGHTRRTEKMKCKNPKTANKAMDAVINEYITTHSKNFGSSIKITLPKGKHKGIYLPKELKPRVGEITWEEVYNWMIKNKKNQKSVKLKNKKTKVIGAFNISDSIKLTDGVTKTNFDSPAKEGTWNVNLKVGEVDAPGTPYDGQEIPISLNVLHSNYKEKDLKSKESFNETIDIQKPYYAILDGNETLGEIKELSEAKIYKNKGIIFPCKPDEYNCFAIHDNGEIICTNIIIDDDNDDCAGNSEGDGKGENDEGFDDHSVWEDIDDSEIDRVLDRSKANAKSIGDTSGTFIDMLEKIRKKKLTFKNILKGQIDFLASEERNFSWRKLNRRLINNDIIEKGLSRSQKHQITVAVDTSGSMGQDELEAAFGALENLLTRYSINLIEIDTEIKLNKKYQKGDWKRIGIHGRGGTVFEKLFNEYMIGHKESLVVITDGEVCTSALKPYRRTIWLVTQKTWPKPFGKFIYLDVK